MKLQPHTTTTLTLDQYTQRVTTYTNGLNIAVSPKKSLSLFPLAPEVFSVYLRSYFILDLYLKFLRWNCQDFPCRPQCKLF
jgi:hypothetical protein